MKFVASKRLFAVIFSLLMVTSIAAPVGAMAASTDDNTTAINETTVQQSDLEGPAVETEAVSDIREFRATLNANLTALGDADSAEVYFQWRENGTENWSRTDGQTVSSPGEVSEELTYIDSETKYEVRAVAETVNGTDAGQNQTFTTASTELVFTQPDTETDLHLWAGFFETLRVDPSTQTGTTSLIPMSSLAGDELPISPNLRKSEVAVYGQDETVQMDFGQGNIDSSGFNDTDVDLVAVKSDMREEEDFSQITSFDVLFEGEETSAEIVETKKLDSSDGTASFSYDLSQPDRGSGEYVFFVVNNGSLSVNDGNITEFSNSRVLGMDLITVQDSSSTISTDRPQYRVNETVNESVVVETEANFDDENITHTVILYDEQHLGEQSVTFTISGSLDNVSTDDISSSGSIRAIDGVRETDPGTSIFGQEVGEQSGTGIFEMSDVVGFLGEQIGTDLTYEEGENVLNVSMTAREDAGQNTTIEVETLTNFTAGEYELLHIAEGNETGQISTNKTTVTLAETLDPYLEVDINEDLSQTDVVSGETISVNATVTNRGDSGTEDVIVFYIDGEAVGQAGSATSPVEFGAGESKSFTFEYTTSSEDTPQVDVSVESAHDSDSITANIGDEPANFSAVINETTSDTKVTAGENLTIDATIENTGGLPDTQDVQFRFDGEVQKELTKEVSLDAGGATTVSFEYNTTDVEPGEYSVSVETEDDTSSTSVTVLEPPNFAIAIEEIDEQVPAGEILNVTANVTNIGEVTGSQDIELLFNDSVEDSELKELNAGDYALVELSYQTSSNDVGEQSVTVRTEDDEVTSTVTIQALPYYEVAIDDKATDNAVVPGDSGTVTAEITNTGDLAGNQSITFSNATGDSINELESKWVEIAGGETETVQFEFDTDPADEDTQRQYVVESENDRDETTVNILSEADFNVTIDEEASDTEVTEGENVSISATIENLGAVEDTQTISLEVGGTEVGNETITLAGEESETVLFEYQTDRDDVGPLSFTVASQNDSDSIDVTVLQQATFDVAINETATDGEVTAGENGTIVANVTNLGDVSGEQDVELLVNGTVEDTRTVELNASNSTSLSFEYATESADVGQLNLTVRSDDSQVEYTVTVLKAPNFVVEITDVQPAEPILAGIDDVVVEANVTNDGGARGTQTVVAEIDGGDVDRNASSIELGPGDNTTETFVLDSIQSFETGEFNLTVKSEDTVDNRTINITEPEPPTFTVDLSVNSDEIVAGEENVSGSVTVNNTGDVTGTQNLTVNFAGRELLDEPVTLDPGNNTTVGFDDVTLREDAGDQLLVAATDDDRETRVISVNLPATFELEVIEDESQTEVVAGQDAELVVEVTNIGDEVGNETLEVNRSGAEIEPSQTSDLDTGDSNDVVISIPTEGTAPGFDVKIIGSDENQTTTVSVAEADSFVAVNITNVEPDPIDEPEEGQDALINVTFNAENLGNAQATQTIDTIVNDEERGDGSDVDLGPGSNVTKEIQVPIQTGDAPEVEIEISSENDSDVSEPVTVNSLAEFEVTIVEATPGKTQPISTEGNFTPRVNVTNVGDQTGNATLDVYFAGSGSPNGTFSVSDVSGGETVTVVDEGDDLEIGHNESGTFALEAAVTNNRTESVEDRSTRSVRIGEASDFEITEFTADEEEVVEGGEIEVNATINNSGEISDEQTVIFVVDGDERAIETVDLDGGNETNVTFTYETRSRDIGDIPFVVNTDDDSANATVTVLEESELVVSDTVVGEQVIADEPFSVDVAVTNVGGVEGDDTARLYLGGEHVGSQPVENLGPDNTTVVTFDGITHDEIGTANLIAVTSENLHFDTVEVGAPGELDLTIRSVNDPLTTDEELAVEIGVENLGDEDLEGEEIVLQVENEEGTMVTANVTEVSVAGGESKRLTLRDSEVVSRTITGSENLTVSVTSAYDTEATEFTLEEPPEEPYFRVSGLDTPDSVLNVSDESFDVNATITNLGGQPDEQTIRFLTNGTEADTVTRDLDGGNDSQVSFTVDVADVDEGPLNVTIASNNSSRTGTVEVDEPDPAEAELVDLEIPESATQEEQISASVEIRNVGDLNLSSDATVSLNYSDGAAVDNSSLDSPLQPGETRTITRSVVPPAETRAGEFDRNVEVEVADADGNVDIETSETVTVDFEGIQSGVDVAEEGDVVEIAPGTYSQRRTITVHTPNVTIGAADITNRPVILQPRRDSTAVRLAAEGAGIEYVAILGEGQGTALAIEDDGTSVHDSRIQAWSTGVRVESGTDTLVRGTRISDAGTGIIMDGGGNGEIAYSRITGTETGIVLHSDNNLVRSSNVFAADVGIQITGENNRIIRTIVRDNQIGILPITPGTTDENGTVIDRSNLEANGLSVAVDGGTVDATDNWWGNETPVQGQDYVARSGIDTSDPLEDRVDPANFQVRDLETPDESDREKEFTVSATVTNDGEQEGLQAIDLIGDGTVIDSKDVELGAGNSTTVSLTHTTDLTDGDNMSVRIRSEDTTTGESTIDIIDPILELAVDEVSSTNSVQAGETITVSVDVDNTGSETELTQDITLLQDGTELTSESVTVQAGGSETVDLQYDTTEADIGTMNLTVAGEDTEDTFNVTVSTPRPNFVVSIDEAASDTQVTAGDTLNVAADIENTGLGDGTQSIVFEFDGEQIDTEEREITSGASDSVTFEYPTTQDDIGENIPITISTDNGSATFSVTVSEQDDDGGQVGGGVSQPTGPSIQVSTVNGIANVGISNADAGQDVSVDLGESVSAGGVSVSQLDLTMTAGDSEFRFEISQPQSDPVETAPALDRGTSISYMNIDPVDLDDEFESAQISFSVAEENLPEDASAEDVRLFRYADGEWQTLETEHRGEFQFVAETPGFSPFAVGVEQPEEAQPDIDVIEANLEKTNVNVDEQTTVSAVLENVGDADGTFTVELEADGEVIDSMDVEVPAGEQREVTFDVAFDEAASYDLSVSGATAGTLVVEAVEEVTTTTTEEPEQPGEGGFSPVMIAILLLVLLAIAGAATYYYTQGQWPWEA